MRLAAGVEYDGTAYNGWQRVSSGLGVQAVVEDALGAVANHDVEAVCAGRTDSGVHASGQVIHFDSRSERSRRGWLLGANSNLPDDVALTWIRSVSDGFHARFSATARTYRYLILNQPVRPALMRHRAWWLHEALDATRMHTAGQQLLGEHDFSAFRAAGCQARTAVREVTELAVASRFPWIVITVTANAFLQHMVRNIVGLLADVGKGASAVEQVAEVLAARDRRRAGVAAPPQGLTLLRVCYPPEFELPQPDLPTLLPGAE